MIIIIKHKSYLDPRIILYVLNVIDQIQTGSCTKKKMIQRSRKDYLLIIKVREDGQLPFHVVKEMHNRSNPWASDWLKRYDKEGLEGLKDRAKAGRPSELPEGSSYQIKKELKESNNQGWITKQVEELIIK